MTHQKSAADQERLKRGADLIEAVEVVDPETGERVPVYEPDPDKPGSYRQTAKANTNGH